MEKVTNIEQEVKEKFKPFSAGAPTMILQNGFGQALAFWISKGRNEHKVMLNIVKEWLSYSENDVQNNFVPRTESYQEFFQAVSTMTQSNYLTVQKETLALLEWIKRFANAGL